MNDEVLTGEDYDNFVENGNWFHDITTQQGRDDVINDMRERGML